uniref:Uncharacterized protein n=1 Tax=viral metagenome TaxID=1070528 RepID=A0A6H1ZID4_9ZZZZ
MKLLKRIGSFLDVERELHRNFGVRISQSFQNPSEQVTITHGLKRVPEGFRVIDKDIADANFGRTAWDNETITLYSTMGGVTVLLEIF